uniref:ATP synthase epsilon chain, chloroplastic n=1 Tax=Chara vulgaris TaxID=55564 RepID=ATPE_CHAVU|nr:ATP synthase CF1 epsilon subunit [Chara vulgaris]Q1ACK2.1 RecName: Full=ATP synthase epsilon chain, chloroplastic; AltName: Full=ATP synthase F1 sector epsilon subunit; AltName: Full=F-ATPase epsilon subunit [Chara vulgaris]ABA61928.1 CF1 epsilon subunit of ATP synthase [Chara vulgaris]WAP91317.1 ATP synthase CF1 epsilon subunit [Chara vulgaris]
MTLNLRIMAPNRIVWNSQTEQIILSTNSGQIGVLKDHTPLLTALDIGVIKIRIDSKWTTMALMGGFAMIDSNQVTILVNEAEEGNQIDLKNAQENFQLTQQSLLQAKSKKQIIEAKLAFKRAKARLEAISMIS